MFTNSGSENLGFDQIPEAVAVAIPGCYAFAK
jgi:hypothetical protein